MKQTANYNLPEYEASDAPNLITGYNAAVESLDMHLKQVSDKVDALSVQSTLPEGLAAFVTALGLTLSNAADFGAMLKRLLTKSAAANSTFTVKKLSDSKVTEDGFIFVPREDN